MERKEAKEIASEQGCRRRGRGGANGHQMRNSPGDQERHRKKAEDNGRLPPERGIQCGGPERTGGEGGTRLGRRKARQEGHEAPGGGHARCRPQINGQRRSGALVDRRTPRRPAHEQGADAARHDERAAKRARGAHADKLEHSTEREDKEETIKYVPRGRVADWEEATVR